MNNLISLWNGSRYICIDESETIVNLVEPVLKSLGWDTGDSNEVEKANSDSHADFRLYKNGNMFAAIECKALHSSEFKIYSNLGAISYNSQSNKYENIDKDGVGQIRRYSMEYKRRGSLADPFFAAITNGLRWVIFDKNLFLDDASLSTPIHQNMILFDEIIVKDAFLSNIRRFLARS